MRIWVFYFTLIFALFYLSCLASEPDQNKRDTGLICAVDMGSNTFKFVVAELKNGKYIQHTDVRKTAGVGDDLRASEQKLKRKIISDAKIQQIQSILTEFQNDCENRTGSRRFRAIATAAFREAENIEFISRKLEEQGVRIQVLTPEEESIFAYEAATLGETGLAVVDVGSRTTEFVHKSPDGYKWVLLNTGYQNAWKDFYENTGTFSEAARQHREDLETLLRKDDVKILQDQKALVVIEVGETASHILGIPQNQIEGKIITRLQLEKALHRYQSLDEKAFGDLKTNFTDAARVLPRIVLLDLVLKKTGYNSFRCTNRELNAALILQSGQK